MSVLVRIFLFVIVLISDTLSIFLEHRLPNRNKSVKWNLEMRGLAYQISSAINFVIAVCIMKFVRPEGFLSRSKYYFIVNIFTSIIIFCVVYILDKNNIDERFNPYINDVKEEFAEYKKNAYYLNCGWRTCSYALFKTVTTVIYLNTIF